MVPFDLSIGRWRCLATLQWPRGHWSRRGQKFLFSLWFLLTTASIPDGVRTLQGSSRFSKIDIAWRYVFVPAAESEGVLPKISNMKMSPMLFLTIPLYHRKPSSQQMGRSSLSLGTILCLELEVRVRAKKSIHENSSLLHMYYSWQ